MGIVAMHAKEILLLPIPCSGSLSVDSQSPIPVLRPVTLAAQLKGFVKSQQSSIRLSERIPLIGIVTGQTPPVLGIMIEKDVIVHIYQVSPLRVRLQIHMAIIAWIVIKGGRFDRDQAGCVNQTYIVRTFRVFELHQLSVVSTTTDAGCYKNPG
jgi:hypothetical protein